MKKTFKIAIASVLILLAGTAGVLYYFLNVKEYDVADEKVEKITKAEYKVDLPDLDSLLEGEEGSDADRDFAGGESEDADSQGAGGESPDAVAASGDSTSTSATDAATGSDESNSDSKVAAGTGSSSNTDKKVSSSEKGSESGKSSSKSTEGKKKDGTSKDEVKNEDNNHEGTKEESKPVITAEMIKSAYRPSFANLEAQANANIDALVNAAYSEYNAKKQNGESVSYSYFYRKYTSAGKALEANTDATFNYLYGALVNDLQERGFSSSEASEFKTQYENAKSARESALIDKAKSAL
jgi:hypothetical protein